MIFYVFTQLWYFYYHIITSMHVLKSRIFNFKKYICTQVLNQFWTLTVLNLSAHNFFSVGVKVGSVHWAAVAPATGNLQCIQCLRYLDTIHVCGLTCFYCMLLWNSFTGKLFESRTHTVREFNNFNLR